MSERIEITLVSPDNMLDGTPIHLQIVDSGHQCIRNEIVRVGAPHVLDLPGGTYAVRAPLPSGDVTESGFHVSTGGGSHPVPIDLAPHLPHAWLEPAAVLTPPAHIHSDVLTHTAFSTAWIRLWACHGSAWQVVPWPHPSVLRSAHGVRFAFRGLDVVPHAIQVGTAFTPWHITRLPLTAAPLVTVRPAVRPTHLRVSVLSGETAADALLGYLASGDTRAAELIGRSLTKDPKASHTQFQSAGLNYHLLHSGAGADLRPELLLATAGTADGALLSAWAMLERMRAGLTEQSAEQVCLAFLRAASAGLPSCAQGLVKLIDGLRLAASSHTASHEDARAVLDEYSRYLAHTDMTSPLLAFHGSRPDTPGLWKPGTPEIPYGAVLLTSPPLDYDSSAAEPQCAALPGDLVMQAIRTLDVGLEWRMPVTRWTEAADCVGLLQRALTDADWEAFGQATHGLRELFAHRGESVGAVHAPDWIRSSMRELLARCSVVCGRSVEPPRPVPAFEAVLLQPHHASSDKPHNGRPDNDSTVSLYATAFDTDDAALLETSIGQFRQLLDTMEGTDPLRPTVLVNYAIALWTLNEWTDEISPQGDPVRCLSEAISLTGPGSEKFHRRVSCLHVVRTMRMEGRESAPNDTTRPGRAKVLVPKAQDQLSQPLELRLMPAAPTEAARPVQIPEQTRVRRPADPPRARKRVRVLPRYDYEHYSRLAGPLTQPPAQGTYRVQFSSLLAQEPHRFRVALLLAAAPLLGFVLLAWLLQPEHWSSALSDDGWPRVLHITMIALIGLIELSRQVPLISSTLSTLMARDPVPVVPETGTRVAFLTTFVPGKEPLDLLRATLEAAVRLRHRGLLHVWLLDEGNDPEARLLCERLGVHHFSRKGIARWNQARGPHRARTKHGNYNAWLDAHGDDYDYFASVDTDHIPLPNYLERILGYFRDPDVAFVVSPQVYGNNDSSVARAAESQQFFFHALTQRAGNRYGSPMLVGTNNAFRVKALKSVGGLQDSITEDLATGLDIHRTRNPATGKRWRSVYTPDVLAVGEGPSNWTDYFSQQRRWSRGTYEAILKQFPRAILRLSPGRLLHYGLMIAHFPVMALNWCLSALSCFLLVIVGIGSVDIDAGTWIMLYGNALAVQLGVYVWNRRHNVSPHEPEGSSGVTGMIMSAMAAPIYAQALAGALLRRRSRFVVTPKGEAASPDRLRTFVPHLSWSLVFFIIIVYGAVHLRTVSPVGMVWSGVGLALALAPAAWWQVSRLRAAREGLAHAFLGGLSQRDSPTEGGDVARPPWAQAPLQDDDRNASARQQSRSRDRS